MLTHPPKYKISCIWYFLLINVAMSIPPLGTIPVNVLTYSFIHANIWHLLVNIIGIFFWGVVLEKYWGRTRFIQFYLLAALGAGVTQELLLPDVDAIGASGVVFALLTAYSVLFPKRKITLFWIPIRADIFLCIFVLAEIALLVLGWQPQVAHWVHLGGALSAGLMLNLTDRWNCEKQL